MSEFRRDPVVDRWTIVAAERRLRPSDFTRVVEAGDESSGTCPFCPGRETETTPEVYADREEGSVPNGPGWRVRVVSNKYPALRIEGALERREAGLYDRMNGIGAHEVVIESPEHARELSEMPPDGVERVLRAFRARILDLSGDGRFRYILVFKNQGSGAGASLRHGHAQLIATPIIPKAVQEELDGAARHWRRHERCVYCDIVAEERRDRERLVLEEEGFVALSPFAPRFPYETWILPTEHASSFETIQDAALPALARALRGTLARLRGALDRPDYNFLLHTAPCRETGLAQYHWHFEVFPNVARVAGFEWGTGFHINTTPPEEAARQLREVLV